jgi:hypothetical protein
LPDINENRTYLKIVFSGKGCHARPDNDIRGQAPAGIQKSLNTLDFTLPFIPAYRQAGLPSRPWLVEEGHYLSTLLNSGFPPACWQAGLHGNDDKRPDDTRL